MDDFRVNNYTGYGHRFSSAWTACSGYGGAAVEKGIGNYFLGTRLYLPGMRRFSSADVASPFGAGGLNRYAYCGGDPINRIDPSGQSWQALVAAVLMLPSTAGTGVRRVPTVADATPGVVDIVVATVPAAAPRVRSRVSVIREATLQWLDEAVAALRGPRTRIVDNGGGATITIHRGPGHASRALRKDLLIDDGLLGTRPAREYEPRWHATLNAKQVPVHAPDTPIRTRDTFEQMLAYLNQTRQQNKTVSASDMVLISGGHGDPKGRNWTASGEWANPDTLKDSHYLFDQSRVNGKRIFDGLTFVNLSNTTATQFRDFLNGDKAVFFDVCFGLADPHLTETLSIDKVTLYDRLG